MIPLLVWGNHHCSEAGFQDTFNYLVKKQNRYNNPNYIVGKQNVIKPTTAVWIGRCINGFGNGPTVHVIVYGDKEIHYDSTLSYVKSRFQELINEIESRPQSFAVFCGIIPNDDYNDERKKASCHFDKWLKGRAKNKSNILSVTVRKRLNSRHYNSVTHLTLEGQQIVAQSLAKALFSIPRDKLVQKTRL